MGFYEYQQEAKVNQMIRRGEEVEVMKLNDWFEEYVRMNIFNKINNSFAVFVIRFIN